MTDHCDVQIFFLRFERSFCRCMAVMSCALGWCVCDLTCFQMMWLVVRWFVVLPQRTTPVLLCTTKYYSSTTLQYYNVLLCTTKYYSSTTLYYKVLLQYYSVLQRTTRYDSSTTLYYKVLLQYYYVLRQYYNVLICTTKYYKVLLQYYSSTILYYKVLLQYYSVLQSTTPVLCQYYSYYKVLLRYYSVLQSTTPVLLCTTQYYASTTLYYASTTTYYSVLQSTTKYYSSTTLYYKVLHQYYSVRQSTTPVLLCTTKYYNLYYKVLLQYHSVLQSTTPVLLCTTPVLQLTTPVLLWNVIYNARRNKSQRPTSPNTAPATQNECHQWSASHMKRHFQCVEQVKSPSNLTKYCAYHEILKLKISADSPWMLPPIERRFEDIRRYPRIKSSSRTRRFGDLTRPILETILYCKIQHFALRLSPKMSRSAAPVTKSPTRTSPNTAPATQNECHQWSASHMKPHFQCVEQVKSPSNLTKYCACHAKWMSSMICVTYETSFPMRGATKVTLQPHQILRLPRNLEAQDFIGNSLKCFRQ